MTPPPNADCAGCGTQIGHEGFVVCWDGIVSKTVVFHSHCNPTRTDVQRHFNIGLAPGHIDTKGQGLGS